MPEFTWAQAVEQLRRDPNQQEFVRACYYDDPLFEAAQRFANSNEWQAVRTMLPLKPGAALDLGAGRGISSYALAREGWRVTALEPNHSLVVGAGAIRKLAQEASLPITVVEEYAETLPFDDDSFDLVYGRQVLHHARDLSLFCQESARVLKPGGRFIATREHVISKREDLQQFLNNHPLHKLYGGENAYLLKEYISAILQSGLHLKKTLGPWDSTINYSPTTPDELLEKTSKILSRIMGRALARSLISQQHSVGRFVFPQLMRLYSKRNNTPGRLYSFIAEKY